jgi:tetratricopeptide (TPR) repeat protein
LSLLAQYPGEASTAAFDLALADEDALVRYTALTNASAATAERLVDLLSPLLFDPVDAVRMEAASRLADAPPGTLEPYQQEALSQGLAEFRAAMTRSLDFSFAALNLGNLASRLGDAFEAERYFRMAVEIDDLFAPAKVNLALLLNATGRNDEAERLLREVMEQVPDSYEVAYNLGLLLAEMNRIEEGVEYLGIASDGWPDRARVHYNYGLSLQFMGRLPEAEQALLRALSVEPQNVDFLFALADHYLRQGDAQRALEMADRILTEEPNHEQGQQLRAAAMQAMRR